MLLIVLKIEVIGVFAISGELCLDLGHEMLLFLAGRHSLLPSLHPHHFLYDLEACNVGLRLTITWRFLDNLVTLLVKKDRRIWVRRAD